MRQPTSTSKRCLYHPLSRVCGDDGAFRAANDNRFAVVSSSDTLGNLTSRSDMLAVSGGESETFCYDKLNRLTNAAMASTCSASGATAVSYDSTGDILTKTGVGTYTYGAGAAGPHAVSAIASCSGCTVNGIASPTYAYDANGNMLTGAGRMVAYTSFNMTLSVAEGTTSVALTYDPEHARIQQVASVGGVAVTTTYYNDPAANVMTEAATQTGQWSWKTYIVADGRIVAQRLTIDGASTSTIRIDGLAPRERAITRPCLEGGGRVGSSAAQNNRPASRANRTVWAVCPARNRNRIPIPGRPDAGPSR